MSHLTDVASISDDDTSHFLQTERSLFRQPNSFAQQGRPSLTQMALAELFQIGLRGDQSAHLEAHPHDLIQADATFAAGVKTLAATFAADKLAASRVVHSQHLEKIDRRIIRGFAVGTDGA